MSQATVLPIPSPRLAEAFMRGLHASLLVLGIAAALVLAAAVTTGELPAPLRDILVGPTAAESAPDAAVTSAAAARVELNRRMQTVADAIAKRYRIAQTASDDIVRIAERSATAAGVDPMLVLAMIAIESGFNPYAESTFGAQGLMQIITKFHTDKFEQTPDGSALLDPETNIRVGVQILREYRQRTGNLVGALKLYGGESDSSGVGYAGKVLAEQERLEQSLARTRKS